jgi:hypothetical protein
MASFSAGEVLAATDLNNAINGPTVNAQTGTSYTFVATDTGKLVTFNNASAVTVTVPPSSSVAFEVGASIGIAQLGAGAVTLAPGSGVTINGGTAVGAQYHGAQLYYLDSNTWLCIGDVS